MAHFHFCGRQEGRPLGLYQKSVIITSVRGLIDADCIPISKGAENLYFQWFRLLKSVRDSRQFRAIGVCSFCRCSTVFKSYWRFATGFCMPARCKFVARKVGIFQPVVSLQRCCYLVVNCLLNLLADVNGYAFVPSNVRQPMKGKA